MGNVLSALVFDKISSLIREKSHFLHLYMHKGDDESAGAEKLLMRSVSYMTYFLCSWVIDHDSII